MAHLICLTLYSHPSSNTLIRASQVMGALIVNLISKHRKKYEYYEINLKHALSTNIEGIVLYKMQFSDQFTVEGCKSLRKTFSNCSCKYVHKQATNY